MHIRSLLLVAAVLLAGPAAAQTAAGKWNATLSGPDGPFAVVFDLAVDAGGRLTGLVNAAFGSASIRDGKMAGNKVSFAVEWQTPDGRPLRVDYTGVLKGDDLELAGKWMQAPPDGPAPFTVVAKRQR